jgi:hypothetical protein
MKWIKDNLVLIGSVVVAIALLVVSTLYLFSKRDENQKLNDNWTQLTEQLEALVNQDIYPSQDNVKVARDSTRTLRKFVEDADKLFPAPHVGKFNNQEFKIHIDKVIADLAREAKDANVSTPTNYAFAFGELRPKPNLLPYSIGPLSVQLAEASALSRVLFKARVRGIESIQRLAVSTDDPVGSADYLTDRVVTTNAFATFTPYRLVFKAFSAELGAVLNEFAKTPEFVIVRTIDLGPAEREPDVAALSGGPPMVPPIPNIPSAVPPVAPLGLRPPGVPIAPRPSGPGAVAAGATNKPVTVLQERALRVTMLVEVVKSTRPAKVN